MTIHETWVDEVIRIDNVSVGAYTIPTDLPESDGTIAWDSTTLVLVEVSGGGKKGIGYTYGNRAVAELISGLLMKVIANENAMNIPAVFKSMVSLIRNDGNCGLAMMAVSAVDTALWDLKAKMLDVPLCILLGKSKNAMPVYGSGGFTSYNRVQLQQQLNEWCNAGISNVKIKIGRKPDEDEQRVKFAREAIGENVNLFVDANGAYTVKQAVDKSHHFSAHHITWFEEPVSSDNLEGLNFIRNHVQPEVNISAGEYGYNPSYFNKMLGMQAVDVLQADATRCGGITGFLKAGYLAEAYSIPFSSHCAPALHLHAALSLPDFYIAEYFHDHVRIESMLFDGFQFQEKGFMKPDMTRPGLGLEFKHRDAEQYKL